MLFNMQNTFTDPRSDAQRAAKQKERKEKELEQCAFNAEQIEDSSHTHSLVSSRRVTYSIQFVDFAPFYPIYETLDEDS